MAVALVLPLPLDALYLGKHKNLGKIGVESLWLHPPATFSGNGRAAIDGRG